MMLYYLGSGDITQHDVLSVTQRARYEDHSVRQQIEANKAAIQKYIESMVWGKKV